MGALANEESVDNNFLGNDVDDFDYTFHDHVPPPIPPHVEALLAASTNSTASPLLELPDYDYMLVKSLATLPPPPATDFPATVPHFGVNCIVCHGVAECELNGNPHFCKGSISCFVRYAEFGRGTMNDVGWPATTALFAIKSVPTHTLPLSSSLPCSL
jgi:hypothetical protein